MKHAIKTQKHINRTFNLG